jgi:hypothetical protein
MCNWDRGQYLSSKHPVASRHPQPGHSSQSSIFHKPSNNRAHSTKREDADHKHRQRHTVHIRNTCPPNSLSASRRPAAMATGVRAGAWVTSPTYNTAQQGIAHNTAQHSTAQHSTVGRLSA